MTIGIIILLLLSKTKAQMRALNYVGFNGILYILIVVKQVADNTIYITDYGSYVKDWRLYVTYLKSFIINYMF